MEEKCVVLYECWQMECCGKPFSKGDTVKWLVLVNGEESLNTPVDLGKIDYIYEAHSADGSKLFVLEGKVEQIKILYQRYEPLKENSRILAPVSGKTVDAETAKGFEPQLGDMSPSDYIVSLEGFTIRAAGKNDVIFK